MASIIFLETRDLAIVHSFYGDTLGMQLWLDQGACRIYRDDNLMLGFCEKSEPRPMHGMLTWFYPSREEVDQKAKQLHERITTPPQVNAKFRIYQCFAEDPEGRVLEFQHFLHDIDWTF